MCAIGALGTAYSKTDTAITPLPGSSAMNLMTQYRVHLMTPDTGPRGGERESLLGFIFLLSHLPTSSHQCRFVVYFVSLSLLCPFKDPLWRSGCLKYSNVSEPCAVTTLHLEDPSMGSGLHAERQSDRNILSEAVICSLFTTRLQLF